MRATCVFVSRRACSATSSEVAMMSNSPSKIACPAKPSNRNRKPDQLAVCDCTLVWLRACEHFRAAQLLCLYTGVCWCAPHTYDTSVSVRVPYHRCSDFAEVVGRWLQGAVLELVAGWLHEGDANGAVGPVIIHAGGQVLAIDSLSHALKVVC
jgi:hypothetical protein